MVNVDIIVKMIDQTQSGASGVTKSLAGFGAVLTVATVSLEAFKKAMEMSEEAAQMQRLADAGTEVARQMGGNMDLIVQKVKEASRGTVSEMDIIASANKAMMLGLGADADQLANLMEIAAFRGRAMGVSTTQAFDDIVRGIGRASPMILDNLGIVVSAKETYDTYAEQIGKSANELTKAEKTQALLNAVLLSGNDLLDKAGGLAEDNASAFERWNAELENTQAYITGTVLPMSRLADMGSDLLVSFRELADNGFGYGGEKLNLFSLLLELGEKRVANMKDEMYAANDANAAHAEALNEVATVAEEVYIPSLEEQAEALKAVTEANEGLLSLTQSISEANRDYDESIVELTAKQTDLNAQIDEAILKYGENSSQVAALREKYAEVGESVEEAAAKHRDAMNSITYDLMIAKLKADGFTDAEYAVAIAAGTALGQIDKGSADTALAMDKITTAALANGTNMDKFGDVIETVMADGVISTEELTDALAQIDTTEAQDSMSGLQSSLDELSTDEATAEVDAYLKVLNSIPGEIITRVKVETDLSELPTRPPGNPGKYSDGQSGQVINIYNSNITLAVSEEAAGMMYR